MRIPYTLNKANPSQVLHYLFSIFFSFETVFVLFLFAGRFKADPRLQWVPVDLTLLFFITSIIIACYIMIFRRKLVFQKKALVLIILYALFSLYVFTSLSWSPSKIYSVDKTLYIGTLTFWTLIATSIIISKERIRLVRFLLLILLFSLVTLAEAVIFYLDSGGQGFINVLGGNYLGVGRTLGLGFLVILGYILFDKMKWKFKLLLFGLLALYLFLLLSVGGRGPLLASLIASSIPIFYSIKISKIDIKLKKYILGLVIFMFLCIIYIAVLFLLDKVPNTIWRLLVIFQEENMGSSAGTRLEYYLSALSLWMDSPILGHGIGAWPVLYNLVDQRLYPHNFILEVLVELGLLGLFMILLVFLYALWNLYSNYYRSMALKVIILMLFITSFINAMVSGDIPDNRILFCFLGLMMFHEMKREKNQAGENQL